MDIDTDGDRRFDADEVGDGERPAEKLSLALSDEDSDGFVLLDTDADARTETDGIADLEDVRDTEELVDIDGELDEVSEFCGDFELSIVEDAIEFEDVGDADNDD